MFGIPLTTVIMLLIKYGPEVEALIAAEAPVVKGLITRSAPLIKKMIADPHISTASPQTQAQINDWMDRQGIGNQS